MYESHRRGIATTSDKAAPEGDVEAYIAEVDRSLREVVEALRQLVLKGAPGIEEGIKWGQPCYSRNGNICNISADRGHVKLGFFKGGDITDPEGHLEGTGKKMRHIKVRLLEDIQEEAFAALVREAVNLSRRE